MNLHVGIYWIFHVSSLSLIWILNTYRANAIINQQTDQSSSTGLVYEQSEILNGTKGVFGVLEWTINRNESRIIFQLTQTAKRTGQISVLGLSKTGNLDGAELVIIRGNLEGQYNAENKRGVSKNVIKPNSRNLWTLDSFIKNEGKLTVILSIDLNTCDLFGYTNFCIDDNMLYILWGSVPNFETEDPLPKRFIPEGTIQAYLTDPQMYLSSLSAKTNQSIKTWKVSRRFNIPKKRHTSYWCSIKKAPLLSGVHHIIGYVPYFADSTSEQHVHHQLLYRCVTPPGINATQVFEPLLDFPGEECYLEETHQLPSQFCTEMVYAWNRGGKPFYFPENVGVPIGEQKDEYFLLEIHYDNPNPIESRKNVMVESGVNVLYSDKVRPIETSILMVGVGNFGLFMVPPNSANFKVGGLCSSDCTKDMLTGIGATNILAANLHAHMATHKIRLRHFRNDKELDLILGDENYDASFQIMRHLKKPVRIMPGDQLGVECVMNTGNETILSGFSTRDEMCFAFLFIDKRLDYLYCSSEYPTEKTLERYGIQKISWDKELQERVIRKSDGSNLDWVGRTLQSVFENGSEKWTENNRRDLEIKQMYGEHDSLCPATRKLVRIVYALSRKGNGSRVNEMDNFERKIKSMIPTTETVSTPGFLSGECEWPIKPNMKYQLSNVSVKLGQFGEVYVQMVIFVVIWLMV